MAVLTHFLRKIVRTKPSSILLFHLWKIKKNITLDITLEGVRAGPGGDCEAIGEAPPECDVGSFTKRSEVKRRATSHGSLFILWNCPLSRWHHITSLH